MFNTKTIRSICLATLLATFVSIAFNGFQNTPDALATNIATFSPISTVSIQADPSGAGLTSGIASAMDDQGNQVYIWVDSFNPGSGTCSRLNFQKFQISGLPLTDKSPIETNCTSNHEYRNPQVVMDSFGNFIVAWMDVIPTSGLNRPKIIAYNAQGNKITSESVNVNDDDTGVYENAKATIAIKKDRVDNLNYFGVSWIGCASGTSCTSQRLQVRTQMFSINFSGAESLLKTHTNNIVLNPTPYESIGDSPSIAFGAENYLVSWPGYQTTNDDSHWNIFGKQLSLNGTATTSSPFELSAFSSRESDINLTGTHRGNGSETTPEVYYLALTTDYLNSNKDVYIEKITCTASGCASTIRANGSPVFVRANTTTTENESAPIINVYTNANDTDRQAENESTAIDYLNITWSSYNISNDTTTLRTQNFKNGLARIGTETSIGTHLGANFPSTVSMDLDGNYLIAHTNDGDNQINSNLYQSIFLRIGAENLIHAPDSDFSQYGPKTVMNSNGNYIITYVNNNQQGYSDINFNLYDKYSNPIKFGIVDSISESNSGEEDVAFFNEQPGSANYGKFIITWNSSSNSGYGLYYQIFNADGTPEAGAVRVTSDYTGSPHISTGKYKQFLLAYHNIDLEHSTITINYLYQNDNTAINGSANVPSTTSTNPVVALNPLADGSFGSDGNSTFAIAWSDQSSYRLREGYLSTNNSVHLGTETTGIGNPSDISSANLPELATTVNPFLYALVSRDADNHNHLYAYSYNHGIVFSDLLKNDIYNTRIAIDKGSGNLLLAWENFTDYSNQINPNQLLYFTKDSHTLANIGDHVFGERSGAEATISGGDLLKGFYYLLQDASDAFRIDEQIDITNDFNFLVSSTGQNFYFDHDITGHFTVGQTITGLTNGDIAQVDHIYSNFIHANILTENGTMQNQQLDNAPYNDVVLNTDDAVIINKDSNTPIPYVVGDQIADVTTGATGTIMDINLPEINIANLTGTFKNSDLIRKNLQGATFSPDIIGNINAQFYRAKITNNGDAPISFTKFGPEFSANTHFNYGQYLQNPDIDFDSRSADNDGKLAVTTYSISGDDTYLDENGVLQQVLSDPFSIGQVQDLSPQTNQSILSGGKYIVVPQVIDFGNLNRGETGKIKFNDLSMPYGSPPGFIQVTDLDGTDFDLTVSLTDLTNSNNPTDTIPNSNFIIENNDGDSPGVTSNYSFTNINDVSLDPSTDPGQDANLSTTQTLLRKSNNNTGVWSIHPTVKLTIPKDASSGVYSGTITFTLI